MNQLESYIHHNLGISVEHCKAVSELFKPELLEKGSFYLKAGHYCNKLSFVENGILRVYVNLPEKEVTQWIGTAGYFATDLQSFMFRQLGRFNIQALTDVRLFTIGYEDYIQLGKI